MKLYIGKPILYTAGGILIGLSLSYFFFKTPTQKPTLMQNKEYMHVREVVDWDTNLKRTQELIPFQKAVEEKIEKYKKDGKIEIAAYYFRDLNNGPWFGINEDIEFNLASLFKVPTLLSYYRLAEENPQILEQTLVYDGKNTNVSDTYNLTKPKENLISNQKYTIQELLERMIIHSDNEAFRMLVENADTGLIADPYNIVEMEIGTTGQEFTSTLRQYSPFFRVLYNSSYLSPEYSEKALMLLSKTEFKDGIVSGVPKDIEVAHKFGIRETTSGTKQLHDCGIVYHKRFPYTLCIMTRGENLESLVSVIQELSLLTYNNVDSQAKNPIPSKN